MDEEDIAAPSDWKDTALSVLIPLDSNLRCLICKDYYTAPVITTCLHTFCSLCIRRCLSVDSICPACRTTNISDSGLRQNKVVADLVENFLTARPRLLEIARGQASTQTKQNDETRIKQSIPTIPGSPLAERPPSPGISCPICGCPFKTVQQVDRHIDNCTPSSPKPESLSTKLPTSFINRPPEIKPLPKVNYAMYNEIKLRQLLSQHRLPTNGNKSLLIARHKEFVNLYNANIDRPRPLSPQELLHRMAQWELTQQNSARPEKRRIDGEEWGRKNKDEFAELTRLARGNAKRRKAEE